jgi:hypothetical protein
VLDFGSPLPFNFVLDRTPQCWCAYYCRLGIEEETWAGLGLGRHVDMWAYFLWRPRKASQSLENPDMWAYVDEVPYEHIYLHVRRDPLYLLSDMELDLIHCAHSNGSADKSASSLSRYWLPWSSQ